MAVAIAGLHSLRMDNRSPDMIKKSSLDLFSCCRPKGEYVKSLASGNNTLVGSSKENLVDKSLNSSPIHLLGTCCILNISILLPTSPVSQTVFQSPPIIILQSRFLSSIPSRLLKKSLPVPSGPYTEPSSSKVPLILALIKIKFSSGSQKVSIGLIQRAVSVKIATPRLLVEEFVNTSYFFPFASLNECAFWHHLSLCCLLALYHIGRLHRSRDF